MKRPLLGMGLVLAAVAAAVVGLVAVGLRPSSVAPAASGIGVEITEPGSRAPRIHPGGARSEARATGEEQPLTLTVSWAGHPVAWSEVEVEGADGVVAVASQGRCRIGLGRWKELSPTRAVVDGFAALPRLSGRVLALEISSGAELRVVAAATSQPIDTAEARFRLGAKGREWVLTGSRVRLPEPSESLRVEVSARGWATRSVLVLPGAGERVVLLEAAGARVTLRVPPDETHGRIDLYRCSQPELLQREVFEAPAQEGSTRELRRVVPPGEYEALLYTRADTWSWSLVDRRAFRVEPGEGELVLDLSPRARVSPADPGGQIAGSVDLPAEGLQRSLAVELRSPCTEARLARVALEPLPAARSVSWSFEALAPGDYRVVLVPELLAAERTVQPGAPSAPVAFDLRPEARLRVWPLDGELLVEGASASLSAVGEFLGPGPPFAVTPEGALEARTSRFGDVWLSLEAPGYARSQQRVSLSPGVHELNVQLDKAPVSKLHLSLHCQGTELPVTVETVFERLRLVDAAGRVLEPFKADPEDLGNGACHYPTLYVHGQGRVDVELREGGGYAAARGSVELVPGELAELSLELRARVP